jgi:hypothetical protein
MESQAVTEIVEQIKDRLATSMAKAFDDRMTEIVRKHIGDAPLESLRGRLTRVSRHGSDHEDWFLDGQHIARTGPWQIVHEGQKVLVRIMIGEVKAA